MHLACRYTAENAARLIERHSVTAMIAVPAMIEDLAALAHQRVSRLSGSAVVSVTQQRSALGGQTVSIQSSVASVFEAQRDGSSGGLPSLRRVLIGAGGVSPKLQVRCTAP